MKLLIATVALATVIAVPAFAQTANQRTPAQQSQFQRGNGPVNQNGRTENGLRHSGNPANDVYDSAHNYLGSDPDARVRLEILRDPRE
jgi:hypothetical protein